MLLTISQPPAPEFGFRSTSSAHDFAPRFALPKPRVSPTPRADSPVSSLPASVHQAETSRMSTPHRGLPPPSAMALPEPTRAGVPPLSQSLGVMPAPPAQWHGQEDSMRNWLLAKAEEDKRKQEEEKTRQEQLRLEQRKVEQAMLRESLQGGIPPTMIPIMYAGIGGANLASLSMELIQQYTGQLQAAQQQLQYHTSPDVPRETRMIAHGPAMYAAPPQLPQQPLVPSQPVDQAQAAVHPQQTFSAYQPAPGRAAAPTSAPRSAAHAQLPRLTTNEMSVQQPPAAAHVLQQSQAASQDQATSSPSIYFHHWVPPGDSKPSSRDNNPSTPASKGEPQHAHTGSHLSESDYRESPRKRKAQGAHQANPPPPSTTSPSFSTGSSGSAGRKSGSHVRSRSIASTSRQDPDSRPGSSRRDADTHSMRTSSSQQRRAAASSSSAASAMPRRRSDEERQSSRRRSMSRQRDSSRRRSSADAARELLRPDRPAVG